MPTAKPPELRRRAVELAREAGCSHEDYLAAVLDREVSPPQRLRRTPADPGRGVPGAEDLEEFVFDHQPGIRRDDIAPLAAGHYLTEARNVVLIGPPGVGKTHCEASGRVLTG